MMRLAGADAEQRFQFRLVCVLSSMKRRQQCRCLLRVAGVASAATGRPTAGAAALTTAPATRT